MNLVDLYKNVNYTDYIDTNSYTKVIDKININDFMRIRKEPLTEKQKDYIALIESIDSIPRFKGTTKKEASLYIAKYGSKISVNSWTIKRGY